MRHGPHYALATAYRKYELTDKSTLPTIFRAARSRSGRAKRGSRQARLGRSDRHGAFLRVALTFAIALVASTALADQFLSASGGWQTYINDRFGVSFDFPADVFEPQPPPENGDGRSFRSDNATLQIVAFHNIDDQSPGALKRELLGGDGYEDVTYSPSGETWFVLSGFRGDNIFYEKYLFSDDVVSVFGIEFPTDEKPYYAPMIERIEDSFEAGHSD